MTPARQVTLIMLQASIIPFEGPQLHLPHVHLPIMLQANIRSSDSSRLQKGSKQSSDHDKFMTQQQQQLTIRSPASSSKAIISHKQQSGWASRTAAGYSRKSRDFDSWVPPHDDGRFAFHGRLR
jgi:hypothetical protein